MPLVFNIGAYQPISYGEGLYEALTNTLQHISINLHESSEGLRATLAITMRQAPSREQGLGTLLGPKEECGLEVRAKRADTAAGLSLYGKLGGAGAWSRGNGRRRSQGTLGDKRVVVLNLDHRKLAGPVSPHIGNLSFLRQLSLRNNSLSHEIPEEIGRSKRLQHLSLRNNLVTGDIPANISGFRELVGLDFGRIMLEGEFLQSSIHCLSSSVPSTLRNLSSPVQFITEVNSISGSIPDDLGGLTNLTVFSLGGNNLVEYFCMNMELGLEHLRRAAEKGHGEASYVYGIIRLCRCGDLDFQLWNATKRSRFKIQECREKVRRVIQSIWINNHVVRQQPNLCKITKERSREGGRPGKVEWKTTSTRVRHVNGIER
ncbi:hypothetical protein Acr_00g0096440 [Actinidia rufa]|uniref:At2g35280-like TPR domain-containing protein n=1 Tax=Actinidia rufa TaxID=165716 RepID=A0A7J0E0F8_9ERIC|nr:hypothetical protein Acr_00g0096440 [Actinidia rufa]